MNTPRAVLPLSLSFLAGATPAQDAPDTAAFAWKLFHEVSRTSGNACVSPWSVAVALGMARAGAAGETAREIDAALGLRDDAVPALGRLLRAAAPRQVHAFVDGESKQVDAFTLHAANAAWLAEGAALLPEYVRLLQDEFRAPPRHADFAAPSARATINRWVEEQTRDRIKDLLPAGKPEADARLVLVNCLFLKAPWQDQFAAGHTRPQAFTLDDATRIEVPTMRDTRSTGYAESEQLQLVELPFRGGDLAMLIAVPRDGVALAQAEAALAGDWSRLARTQPRLVQLELPRFTFAASTPLNDALRALGVRQAFDRARADFSRMTPPDDPVFLSDVLHKTFVAVDENGAEAAAATAAVLAPTAAMPDEKPADPIVVRADRPFLFAITHRPAGILFLGRVSDPR